MNCKKAAKKIFGICIFLSIFLSIVPMAVYAVPGAEGHNLTRIIDGTFEGGYDSLILVYCTKNVNGDMDYKINDNAAIFEIPSYNSNEWYFEGWRTWYSGSWSGLGVTTSDKANPQYDDDEYYFTVKPTETIFAGTYYDAGSMLVLKEDMWQGTYYLSAIFKPILTINIGEGVTYEVSGGGKVADNKYAVTQGNSASITYTLDSKYEIKKISASYGTSYSESNGKVTVNSVERPAAITIETALKPKATYTAPIAKELTYNKQEQELVTKGTTTEGTLMYGLEENGTYTENVPTGKNVGDYKVWYYVKGDANHNDGDKQYVEVSIEPLIPDIGTVTAEIPNNTLEISHVVLTRTNTTIPGILKLKSGQSLKLGENELEYIFIPNEHMYEEVSGKVSVIARDTIPPTGKITISGSESTLWTTLIENISFNLYFATNQVIKVSTTDNLSGVNKIEYYVSDKALDLIEIETLNDDVWSLMPAEGVEIIAENEKQFVCYVRIEDKAGNISILSTDGVVFDSESPVISGVQDGKTYNQKRTVIITDKNLEYVKLNGEDVNTKIILDKEGIYEITAVDKAGNTSVVTVEMGKIVANPQTGDNILLFVVIALISMVGIVATTKAKKALKNN